MGLKINGSTSGSIEIDVPAVAGTDTSITIPAKNGGTFIVEESTGNIDLGPLDINGSASDDSVNIDSSGRLLVGLTSTSATESVVLQGNSSGATSYGSMLLARGTTSPSSGSSLGNIEWSDSSHARSAIIRAERESGTWSSSSHPTRLSFHTTADNSTTPTENMFIRKDGAIYTGLSSLSPYNNTTASAANGFITSSGYLARSTSSIKYKTGVETLEDRYADAILDCRPVYYRSLCEEDNAEHGWWGFIAEEVAEIDPRLVHWKTVQRTLNAEGEPEDASIETPEPEGVQYDRFVPHLVNLIKRQKEQLETQAASIASLEARLTALEGGAS